MTGDAPQDVPATAAGGAAHSLARARLSAKPLISPLLRADSGASQADRERLVYSAGDRVAVLVELNVTHGIAAARQSFLSLFTATFAGVSAPEPIPIARQYLRCLLTEDQVKQLGDADRSGPHSIFRIWPDYRLIAHTDRSVSTVKADAAARSYGTTGGGIVWAVIDSGIDQSHPHFSCPGIGPNLADERVAGAHRDFTPLLGLGTAPGDDPKPALQDNFGHGTHIAGIIAGSMPPPPAVVKIAANQPTSDDMPAWVERTLEPGSALTGMAPKTRLLSLKVLDDDGDTSSSVVIAALDYVRTVNADGRQVIHGVNLSIGCDWYPDEYAAGQSPLCRAVNELVSSGVVVVVSAGNSGAGGTLTGGSGDVSGQLSTITDPGNAAKAITVGSTHRFAPHTYGISYTSSKGPTLDGRLKPDLVAPGERITSAAAGAMRAGIGPLAGDPGIAAYVEDSGTSMAAPHVSGAIAAFLSVRSEFIGQPDEVKRLFCQNATSLGRHEFYQGGGMLDLMRVLSSV
ncbi:MAG: S8 family peptidase [Streptosporangiaceae bacterium]